MAIADRIRDIEEEIKKTPYNKASQHHIGLLKAKLALLKEGALKSGGGGGGLGYAVKKSGDATVALVGLPSVGKSTLLNHLTNASSRVAAYQFTTLTVVPGAMDYKGAKIQILDLPGIITGAAGGKGRGREVLAVARSADLILIILDVFAPFHYSTIIKELQSIGIRPNGRPPDVVIKKKSRGGVSVDSTVKLTQISKHDIVSLLNEHSIHNADVLVRQDVSPEEFVDALLGSRAYTPALVVLNKIDLVNPEYIAEIKRSIPEEIVPVSADSDRNLDFLRDAIFRKLNLMRVYLKPQGREADMNAPLVIRAGSTVGDVCDRLHKDFRGRFKYAQVWGGKAKFSGQKAGIDYVLEDGVVLSIAKRN